MMKIHSGVMAFIAPILFALLPITSIMSNNDMPLSYSVKPTALTVILAIILLFVMSVGYRDLNPASAAASLTLMMFFSYGHVYGGFLGSSLFSAFHRAGLIGDHFPLITLWVSLWILGMVVIRFVRRHQSNLAALFIVMALVALVQPSYKILRTEWLIRQPWDKNSGSSSDSFSPRLNLNKQRPDIYYIILDGYARSDILTQVYNFDNSEFLNFLREQGFYIADQSLSNYGQTLLSLASSLNYDYLDSLLRRVDIGNSDRLPLSRLIQHSQVQDFLKAGGYQIISVASGYRSTELDDEDLFLAPVNLASTSLDSLLIDTSALFLFREAATSLGYEVERPGYEAHRQRIEFALDAIPRIAAEPGPKFVFIHIIAPHPPFVFGPVGEPVENEAPYNLLDGNAFAGTKEAYVKGYIEQLQYINHRIQVAIQELMNDNSDPPIIILQADHGPGLGLDWQSVDKTNLEERYSILNAYYLPGKSSASLLRSITPVNTFRLLFNLYFDTEIPLLEDRSMFSTWNRPYDYIALENEAGKLVPSP